MWRGNYELCGISFEEGIEIIVEGFSEVYKPNGRLSFRVTIAELVGEGTLKKAYDQLKKKTGERRIIRCGTKTTYTRISSKNWIDNF
jgi:exodeoxyribonuclease VII large subunit